MEKVVLVAVSDEDAYDYITTWPRLLGDAYVVTTVEEGEGLLCSRVFVTDYAAECEPLVRPLEQMLTRGSYNNHDVDAYPIYLHLTYWQLWQRLNACQLKGES